jgi:hypothetical protein
MLSTSYPASLHVQSFQSSLKPTYLLTPSSPQRTDLVQCHKACHGAVQELPGVLKSQFLPMVVAEATIWTPVQYLNFTLLPVQHQQMFVNVVSILEAAVMSWCV